MENLKDIIVSLIVLLFTFLGKNHTTTHLSAMGDIVVQVQVKDKVTNYCYCFKSLSQSQSLRLCFMTVPTSTEK